MGRSQVVRHRVLISCTVGSNPTAPAIHIIHWFMKILGLYYIYFCVSHEKPKFKLYYDVLCSKKLKIFSYRKHLFILILSLN